MSNTVYVLWIKVQYNEMQPDPINRKIVGYVWDDEEVAKEWAAKHPDRGYWSVEEMGDHELNAT